MLANSIDSSNQHKRLYLYHWWHEPAKGCKPVTEKLLSTFTCITPFGHAL